MANQQVPELNVGWFFLANHSLAMTDFAGILLCAVERNSLISNNQSKVRQINLKLIMISI